MATTDSPLNIKGSIKGLRFYKMQGSNKTYVGQKGGASKPHIQKSPKFKNLRLAQNELRGRAQVAKSIRGCFGIWAYDIVNRYLQLRLTGVLQQVQNLDGPLVTGKRTVELTKFKEVLNQIQWYYYKPLNEIMMCAYSVETREDRKAVTVTLKGLNPKVHIKPPTAASHFQLCVGLGTVTDAVTLPDSMTWISTVGENINTVAWKLSEWIAIDGPIIEELSLTATLRDKFIIKDNRTVIRGFGIVFGKMTSVVTAIPKDRGSIEFLGAV